MNPALIIAFIKALVEVVGKEKVDEALNKMESKYTEGSWKDTGAEALAAIIRAATEVEDSNPDN